VRRRGPGADGRLNTGRSTLAVGAGAFQPSETTESRTLRDLPRRREQRTAARSQPATRPRCRRRAASMSAEPCRGGYGAKPGSRMGAEANACARRFVDSPAAPGSDRLSDPAAAAENPHRFAFAGAPPGTPGTEPSADEPPASPGRTPNTRKRPLTPGRVVRRHGLRVLGPPPPDVLSAARPAPPVQAAQRLRVRPELRKRPVLPTSGAVQQFGRMLAGRIDAFLRVGALFSRDLSFMGGCGVCVPRSPSFRPPRQLRLLGER
jgi:hypothetical protein